MNQWINLRSRKLASVLDVFIRDHLIKDLESMFSKNCDLRSFRH